MKWINNFNLENWGMRAIGLGLVLIFLCTEMTDNENLKSKKIKVEINIDSTIEMINISERDFRNIKSINLVKKSNGKFQIQIIRK